MDMPEWNQPLPCEGHQSENAEQSQNSHPQQDASHLGQSSSSSVEVDTIKILQKFRSAYIEKIGDVIRRNPRGLEPKELEWKHFEIRNETRKLFEMENRRKFGQAELLEHMLTLILEIDEHWKGSVLETNKRNMLRGEEAESQPRVLPPLVFQLQSRSIKMGMLIDGTPQVLKNVWGEESTPFVVGASHEGDFLYGNEVVANLPHEEETVSKSQSKLKKFWWVSEHFLKSEGEAWSKIYQLKDGTLFDLSVEFLLGFILRSLKEQVETDMDGTCSVAVITVPFWFCCSHRLQVKVGGSLAGFADIYLVSDTSAAAHSIGLRSTLLSAFSSDNCILVISENGGVICATLHKKDKKKMCLVSHHGSYSSEAVVEQETRKKSALVMLIPGVAERFQTVRAICGAVLSQAQMIPGNSLKPNWLVLTCESDEWKPILEQVGKEYVPHPKNNSDIGEENAVIIGAALLSENPGGISQQIRDKLAFDLMSKGRDDIDAESESCLISKNEFLPVIYKTEFLVPFPESTKVGIIFQRVAGTEVWAGTLDVSELARSGAGGCQYLEAQTEISSEGIVTMTVATVGKTNGNVNETLKLRGFNWTTPSLGIEGAKRTKLILARVGKSNPLIGKMIED